MSANITITPINLNGKIPKNSKSMKARKDYVREQENMKNGINPKWDDSSYNKSRIGDYFAFVRQTEDIVEIFRIEKILNAEDRPDYWDMPEHQRRNVLCLSKMITNNISWTEFKKLIGYKENYLLRGTSRSKNKLTL